MVFWLMLNTTAKFTDWFSIEIFNLQVEILVEIGKEIDRGGAARKKQYQLLTNYQHNWHLMNIIHIAPTCLFVFIFCIIYYNAC